MKNIFRPLRLLLQILTLIVPAACQISDCTQNALVIEGYITNDDYATVCLMQTISPERIGTSVYDMIVRWGKITLSDSNDLSILTGGPDKSFFPPYTYTTYDIKGSTGQTYTLTAEFNGMKATATTTIPAPADIDSIVSLPAGSDGASRQLILYPRVAPGAKEYYRILVRVKDLNDRLLPGFMGIAESSGTDEPVAIAVNRPKTSRDSVDYIPVFRPGETVEIALCTMEKEAYKFWLDYENAVAFSGSQFLSPSTPLRSNVVNGYGYFFGYGITKKIITIE